jgi:hypothetical protein
MDVPEETSGATRKQHWNKDRNLRKRLPLGSKRASGRIYKKALVLEIVKRRVELSVRIQKVSDRTLVEGSGPSGTKKMPPTTA